MKHNLNNHFPAGILDLNFELFTDGDKAYCQAEGKRWDFPDFPQWVLDVLAADMIKNPKKVAGLKRAGFKEDHEIMFWYIHCCFGAYDGQPDYVDGAMVHSEYFDCGQRGNCPYENEICSSIIHQNHVSFREVEVISLAYHGYQDKEIGDRLSIHPTTVSKHIGNILSKLSLGNRSDIVRFAGDHHVILTNHK